MEHKFRFGIQVSRADSAAEWVAKARQIAVMIDARCTVASSEGPHGPEQSVEESSHGSPAHVARVGPL